jgi:HK97 family phage major capsid protein
MLQGDASGPGPFGILRYTNTTGLPAGTIATNGSTPTYQILVAIVSALRNISMPFNNPGWIFSGRTLQSLQNLTNSIGEPLLASAGLLTVDASGSTGTLLGYKFATTNAISNAQTYGTATNASSIIFSSDWDELFLGEWQALAIDSSAEASYTPDGGTTWISAYQNMQTVFRATIWADMVIRRPAAFVVANGILP